MHWLANGAFPVDQYVCHSCDNRACCNPAHLWTGDTRDNAVDAVVKGRHYQTRKTHCPRGHELPAVEPGIGNRRGCVECDRLRRQGPPASKRGPKEFCKQGHPFSGDNLYVSPKGQRLCRTCVRKWRAEHIARLQNCS